MAYVEVWKSGKLVTCRRVDEQKAQIGCRVRLGSAGHVRVAIGQSETLGNLEVRMFSGEPPISHIGVERTASVVPDKAENISPRAHAAGPQADKRDECPDIEGYRIIEPLGKGGMGVVWRAEQLSTRRQVALKLLVSHRIDSAKAQARFQREVELTSRLDHPNIARIYDSGLHHGMYYYAMELVDGVPLDRYAKSKALSRGQILVLMRTVCQAVLYAHLRAVIHRDLKPSNILVSADGQPHLLDFGLAKALLDEDEDLTISIEGQITGTPAYMSPEQAVGHHSRLDTRTDVFSLGVILYELLTGQSPHDVSGSTFDVLHRITEGRIRRPREVDKSMDGELEAVLLTALAQNPEDRYPSAGALAKDICNYLDGEPLDARVHTIRYFLRKKALKYRVPVAIGLAVSLVLLGTILAAYTKIVAQRAISESKDWEIQLKSAQLTWRELELKALSKNEQEAHAALRIMRDEYVSAQDEISQLNHKLGEKELPVVVRRVDLQPGAALASTTLVRRPFLPGGVQSWTLETYGHHGPVTRLAYSPDGRQLMSAGSDGTIRTWDAKSGQLTNIFVDPNGIVDLPWLADGRDADRFSWSADDATRTIDEITKLWGVDLPDVWQPLLRTAAGVALSPDRTMLAFGDHDGTIRVLDPKSGQLRYSNTPAWCGPVHSVRFSSDSKVLATSAGAGTICLWDAHRWQPLRKFEAGSITGGFLRTVSTVAWGPGDSIITRPNSRLDALEILDSQSGQILRVLSAGTQRIASISWSPDGTLLAAGTIDGKALVWDVKVDSNQPLVTLDAHAGPVNALAWKPQDQSLITAGDDGKIEIWEPRSGTRTKSIEGYPAPITCLALEPEGNVLAAGSDNGIIRLWDATDSWTSTLLRGEPNDTQARQSKFTAVTWSPDGALLASGEAAGKIRIWDPKSSGPMRSFAANCGPISSLAWSADGRVLICGGADGTARAWDAKNDFQEHVVLLPLWGSAGPGIATNREGDYRGPPETAEHLLYVVSTERGQETLTPADFKNRFGWVNEPWQVGLYIPGLEQVRRIYVKADAQPPYDGNSWDAAFNDLQDALKLAQPDTEIWVAAGIYRPDRGTGAREASFHLKNGVRLFGGFAGTETDIDLRNPNRNETILTGDLKGDDGPNFTNNDENSYHVVDASEADETALLDGVAISGGNANGPGPVHPDNAYHTGAGVYNKGGGFTTVNCVFRHNSAMAAGGGIFNIATEKRLTISNCVFIKNSVTEGQGIGGGISNRYGAYCILSNCTFVDNSAYHGGGMGNTACQGMKLTKCTFTNNSAELGGGVWHDGCLSSTFADCVLTGNSGNDGGGMANRRASNPNLINCMFIANLAEGNGGGIANYGSSPTLTDCIFVRNEAGAGAGMVNDVDVPDGRNRILSRPEAVNCTFIRNRSADRAGAIINSLECSSTLTNCILWGNTDSQDDIESSQIQGGRINAGHCCIQGWTGKLGGVANFGSPPLFVDPNGPDSEIGTEDDDLRLSSDSPCINKGDNSALPADASDLDGDGDTEELIPFDIDGKPRIQGGTVDIGAYESG